MSDNLPEKRKLNLPKLSAIHGDPEEALKNDELKAYVNQPPPDRFIKKNKFVAGNPEYIPIDKVELMLDIIFQRWRVEVLNVSVIFNSVAVTVRLHYIDPTNSEWMFHDGVGAKSVQTDSGFSAADLAHIKDGAVQMALPTAKSFAIRDAADHIGKLFGRDLNRKDTVEFKGAYGHPETPPPPPPPADTSYNIDKNFVL